MYVQHHTYADTRRTWSPYFLSSHSRGRSRPAVILANVGISDIDFDCLKVGEFQIALGILPRTEHTTNSNQVVSQIGWTSPGDSRNSLGPKVAGSVQIARVTYKTSPTEIRACLCPERLERTDLSYSDRLGHPPAYY